MGSLMPSTWSLFSSNSVTEFSSKHPSRKFSTIHWFLIIHQPTIPSFSSLQQIHHHQPPEPSGKIEANSRNKDHKRGKTGICRGYSLPHYQALLGLALCCVFSSVIKFGTRRFLTTRKETPVCLRSQRKMCYYYRWNASLAWAKSRRKHSAAA